MATTCLTYLDLAEELTNQRHFPSAGSQDEDQSAEILFTCDAVKLVWIQKTGTVQTASCDYSLKIIRTMDDERMCFLQVMDDDVQVWMYPLIPNVSPCLCSDNALIFPDLNASDDSSIGILIEETHVFAALSGILLGPQPDVTDSIPQDILRVAFIVSKHLIDNAERTNQMIAKGAAEFVKTVPKTSPDLKLPEQLKFGIELARSTAQMTVGVTNFLASAIQKIKLELSHYLSRQLAKHGAQQLPQHTTASRLQDKRLEEIFEICMSLSEAHTTIQNGLNEAAAMLRKSLNENSLVIVEHIYGTDTAKAVKDVLETVENGKRTVTNLKRVVVPPRTVAKQVLKSAGKELLNIAFDRKRKLEVDETMQGDDTTDSCVIPSKMKRTGLEDAEESGQDVTEDC